MSFKYGYEGQGVLETLSNVLESSNLALNLKGGVVKIGGVAVIVCIIFFVAKIHLYICLGKVKKYYKHMCTIRVPTNDSFNDK